MEYRDQGISMEGWNLSTQGKNYPVYATEDNGKVVTVGKQDKGAGNYVVIEYDRQDGTKIQTTYMHLNQIGVKPGDIVNARHQIGVSGNTGRSSGHTYILRQNTSMPMEIGRSLTLSYTSLKWRLEVIKRQPWIRMETMR